MAKDLTPVEFPDTPCLECRQVPTYIKAPFPTEFGHIATVPGLKAFIADGLCEWCGDILADFAVMGKGLENLNPKKGPA